VTDHDRDIVSKGTSIEQKTRKLRNENSICCWSVIVLSVWSIRNLEGIGADDRSRVESARLGNGTDIEELQKSLCRVLLDYRRVVR
jgi:hypothetical protein